MKRLSLIIVFALVVALMLATGGDVNAQRIHVEDAGEPALHGAAREGHIEAVKLLLEAGVDVEAKNKVCPDGSPSSFGACRRYTQFPLGRNATCQIVLPNFQWICSVWTQLPVGASCLCPYTSMGPLWGFLIN